LLRGNAERDKGDDKGGLRPEPREAITRRYQVQFYAFGGLLSVDPPAAAESNGQKCLHLVGSWAAPCVCGQLLPGRMALKLTWVRD
jgi:hypothetical protein